MKNTLKTLLEAWFCNGQCSFFSNENGAMEYFRAEFKNDAMAAYEYWRSTGNANYSA